MRGDQLLDHFDWDRRLIAHDYQRLVGPGQTGQRIETHPDRRRDALRPLRVLDHPRVTEVRRLEDLLMIVAKDDPYLVYRELPGSGDDMGEEIGVPPGLELLGPAQAT